VLFRSFSGIPAASQRITYTLSCKRVDQACRIACQQKAVAGNFPFLRSNRKAKTLRFLQQVRFGKSLCDRLIARNEIIEHLLQVDILSRYFFGKNAKAHIYGIIGQGEDPEIARQYGLKKMQLNNILLADAFNILEVSPDARTVVLGFYFFIQQLSTRYAVSAIRAYQHFHRYGRLEALQYYLVIGGRDISHLKTLHHFHVRNVERGKLRKKEMIKIQSP